VTIYAEMLVADVSLVPKVGPDRKESKEVPPKLFDERKRFQNASIITTNFFPK
jgi:hypothetical protein